MDEILNPTIFIGGLELREPVTTLTDFLVAIVALIGYIKFSKTKDIAKNPTIKPINEFEIILMRKYVIIIPTITDTIPA